MSTLAAGQLSGLIGAIYDCALDPTLWPDTIATIGAATDCFAGVIAVTDLERSELRLMQYWNYDPVVLSRAAQYTDEITGFWDKFSFPLDEPFSTRRQIPANAY